MIPIATPPMQFYGSSTIPTKNSQCILMISLLIHPLRHIVERREK